MSKDALTHHLAIPKLYLQHGGIYEIPFAEFSYYPMNLDLLYLVPLYFGNDIIPKFIHFSFALLTAWLIFNYLKRRINLVYALFGVLFFLSIPVIVKLSITVYVDLGLIFFSTASLLSLLKWIESNYRLRFLIISTVSCGLAMGTKYNSLVAFFLLTFFVPFVYSRYNQAENPGFFKTVGHAVIFALIALLIFSPWMIRNYIWTNNPIYPLYDHWFNPQNVAHQGSLSLFKIRSYVYHESWWEIALLPVRIFFQGQDGNPQYFDGKLNPFLLLLPFLAFFQIRSDSSALRTEKKIMVAFAALFFAFAFFSSGLRVRYISPIIPPLVILSVFGLKKLSDMVKEFSSTTHRKIGWTIIILIILFTLWPNAHYVFTQYKNVRPFDYLNGTLTRDEYIDKFRREYPAIRYINENLPQDARILFFYLGNRGYYCDRDYLFDMQKGVSTLWKIVEKSNSPEEVLTELKNRRITHLLIRYDIFDRWVKNDFEDRERTMVSQFFKKYVKSLYFKWGYGVSRLENLN
ncbi:MAG: glycosyltransferase family 39 protein [Pseudomonadota bacterium]